MLELKKIGIFFPKAKKTPHKLFLANHGQSNTTVDETEIHQIIRTLVDVKNFFTGKKQNLRNYHATFYESTAWGKGLPTPELLEDDIMVKLVLLVR